MQSKRWLLPEGVQEMVPPESWRLEAARRELLDLYWRWGFDLIRPPLIEYLDSLLTGAGHELDLQTFKLTDQLNGRMMGVRSDMTTQATRIDAHRLAARGPALLGGGQLMAVQPRHNRVVTTTHLRISALHELQYRVNFWLQVVESVVATATAVAVIALVFTNTDTLVGWSLDELLVVLGVHVALGGVIKALVQPNMLKLVEDIREGTFDFVLVRPADALLLASVRQVSFWKLVDVVVGIGVVGVAIARPGVELTLWGVVSGALLVLLGVVIVYCFWVALTVTSFWIVRAEHIVELFSGLYQAGRWPVSIYPTVLRVAFTVLVPLAFAGCLFAQGVMAASASLMLRCATSVSCAACARSQ